MLKKLGMMLLAVSIGTLLSSCLVKKKSPDQITTFTSTTNQLRIYQPFDTIYYNVQVDSALSGSQSGTLQVEWRDTRQITDPLASPTQQYSVREETTTLSISDGVGGTNDEQLVRYVEQDNITGSLYLRAFPTQTRDVYYWLSPTNPPTSMLQRFEIFRSPLAMAGTIDLGAFYVASDCSDRQQCQISEALAQSRLFTVTAINQTVDIPGTGIFKNAYRVKYDATTNRQATAPVFDILDVCGSLGNFTSTSHSATLDIVPEIGVIKMVNECTDSASNSDVIYTATLDHTSFPY